MLTPEVVQAGLEWAVPATAVEGRELSPPPVCGWGQAAGGCLPPGKVPGPKEPLQGSHRAPTGVTPTSDCMLHCRHLADQRGASKKNQRGEYDDLHCRRGSSLNAPEVSPLTRSNQLILTQLSRESETGVLACCSCCWVCYCTFWGKLVDSRTVRKSTERSVCPPHGFSHRENHSARSPRSLGTLRVPAQGPAAPSQPGPALPSPAAVSFQECCMNESCPMQPLGTEFFLLHNSLEICPGCSNNSLFFWLKNSPHYRQATVCFTCYRTSTRFQFGAERN